MQIDFTKPVFTRTGLPVTIITTQGRGTHPVLGYTCEDDTIHSWLPCGRFTTPKSIDVYDLEQPEYVYINVYLDTVVGKYATREEANKGAYVGRVGCMKIKIVAGHFDD